MRNPHRRMAPFLASALLAFSTVAYASAGSPTPRKPSGQVVTIVGKNLCYGQVDRTIHCEWRMPVPSKTAKARASGWFQQLKSKLSATGHGKKTR